MDINWESDIWIVLDNYFKTMPHYLSKTQLDSYNIFLSQQIPKTIRQFNPLTNLYYPQGEYHKFKIELFLGATLDGEPDENGIYPVGSKIINNGKGVYINKPIIQQKKYGEEGVEIIEKQLFPNEARLKNITYKMDISVDVFIQLTSYDITNGQVEKRIIKSVKNVKLGSIPIMLHSNACILSEMPTETLYTMGECPYDQGGYFIIDGKEKVIVAQERQVENKLYTRFFKGEEDKYIYEVEIRSVPETIFQPARITKMYLVRKTNAIRIVIPNINAEIPLFIVFRALGVLSDKDIIQLIVEDIDSDYGKVLMESLRDSIIDASLINTQEMAMEYLMDRLFVYGRSIDGVNNRIKTGFLQDALRNYFLPHVGRDYIPKAYFMAYMVRELLLTKTGFKQPTDRDSFINKRIDISGFLIGNIFRDLYFRVKKKYEENINTFYHNVTNADIHWSQGDMNTYQFWNIIDTNRDNDIGQRIHKLLERSIIDKGFNYAFKNCWGLQNATGKCKQGVVQDLNRLNYLGSISHIRRVNTTLSASAKIREPHSLHASSYGIMCPDETPDGGNVGLRKNIALFAMVTFGVHSTPLHKALTIENVIPVYNTHIPNIKNLCKIFLNERLVGFHTNPEILVYRLKLFRRNALLNVYTSIAWYRLENKVKISTDSGRCSRPLLIVKDNRIQLTKTILENIKGGEYSWKKLIGGFRETPSMYADYDDKFHCLEEEQMTNEYLEEHSGVIEYIDTEEANTCLIAMLPTDLENPKNKINTFTHCELHPSLMLGVLANNVPFIERNQHPRNQFSTAQGKQALGIYATNFRNRMDTKGQIMYYPQKPIIQSKMSKYLHNNDLPHGINAIVAIGSYSGYNQEDSILFNKDSVQRGLFRTAKFRTYTNREELLDSSKNIKEEFRLPNPAVTKNMKNGNYSKLNDNKDSPLFGIIKEGEKVDENDILIGKVIPTTETNQDGEKLYVDNSDFVKRNESGFVDKVYFNYGNDGQKYAKVRLRKEKIPEVGDKFCSRYGQKGTIGMLIDARDMPVTKEGIIPDMVVNPHAIPSRMTIGQLLEVILGKAGSTIGSTMELSGFVNEKVENIYDILETECKYEKHANEVLYNGRNGKQLKVSLFIGPTFYQRLTHQVGDKFYSRNEGSKSALTHQPVGGRAAGGGLRIGEMERDAILAHGLSMFLKESMMERADKYKFYISDKSGLMAIVNEDKNIYEDFSNDQVEIKVNANLDIPIQKHSSKISDSTFYCIEAPYAFKLFLQEIESMGIAPRLVVKESIRRWKDITNITLEDMDTLKETITEKKGYYENVGSELTKPLRSFHNQIKSILISGSNKHRTTGQLLDLSAGRGGDIDKWIRAGYTKILGMDIDRKGIEADMSNQDTFDGAKVRLKKHRKRKTVDIEFIVADTSKHIRTLQGVEEDYKKSLETVWKSTPLHSFDTVSSQFSIHYYFNRLQNIESVFQNVTENIKKGGYFIVTCLDGDLVYSKLSTAQKTNTLPIYGSVSNKKVWSINVTDNTRLDYDTLPHTIEDGFNNPILVEFESIGSAKKEYLVSPTLLINIASKYGLKIISNTEASTHFEHIHYGTGLFSDIFQKNPNHALGNSEFRELKEYSDMHRFYIFKYMDDRVIDHSFENVSECKTFMEPLSSFILTTNNRLELQHYLIEQRALHGSGHYINTRSKQSSSGNIFINRADEKTTILNRQLQNQLDVSIYQHINQTSFENTLKYMFENRKVGIFVKIKNGILTMFNPFFNNNTLDEGDMRFIDVPFDALAYSKKKQEYMDRPLGELQDKSKWWLDNCIVNLFGENTVLSTTHFGELKSMLEVLCVERGDHISDVEFFINKQIFPYLRKPNEAGVLMEPYFHALGEVELQKNNYTSYMPILSTNTTDKYADLVIPSAYDWNVSTDFVYPPECTDKIETSTILHWDSKEKKAYFIGPTTGCGTTKETNQRIEIVEIYNKWKLDDTRKHLLEVHLTKWSDEDTIYMGGLPEFQKEMTEVHPLDETRILSMKYLLYIDDYGASTLFTKYLSMGSLILKTKSPNQYKLWYFDMLEPLNSDKTNIETATHIDIDPHFTNLQSVVEWCIENDDGVRKIALNSLSFYKQYITKNTILDYVENLVNSLAKNISNNHVIEQVRKPIIEEEQLERTVDFPKHKLGVLYGKQRKNIKKIMTKTDTTIKVDSNVPKKTDVVEITITGSYQGIELAIDEIMNIANQITKTVSFDNSKIGRLIGKSGKNIKRITDTFNVYINTNSKTPIINGKRKWTITGQPYDVECAIQSLYDLETNGNIDSAVEVCVEPVGVIVPSMEIPEDVISTNHKCGIIIPILSTHYLGDAVKLQENIISQMNKCVDYPFDYKIFMVHQIQTKDSLKPNRGAIINSGVRMALEDGCDYVVIQNVDLVANDELLKEYCVFPTNPVNISSILPKYNHIDYRTKPQWSVQLGIIKISIRDFIAINGYPNDMWGLGYDDYIFLERCRVHNLSLHTLQKPPNALLIDKNKIVVDPNADTFNTIGYLQINKSTDIYLSKDISGVKQHLWFNITETIPFMERLVLINIELDYPMVRPFKSIEWNDYVNKLHLSTDTFVYTHTVLNLMEKGLLYIVGIDYQITDRIVIDGAVSFNIYKSVDMRNPDYLDHFKDRLLFVMELVKTEIQTLYKDNRLEMGDYIPIYLDMGININPLDEIEIYITFSSKKVDSRFNIKRYAMDNEYITYQKQPIRTIPTESIDKYSKELIWFRAEINATYQILYTFEKGIPVAGGYHFMDPPADKVILNYTDTFNQNIQNIKDKIIIDALGKYVCIYNPEADDIDVYDLVENRFIRIYDIEELQRYNTFYSTLLWKLTIDYSKVVPTFNRERYNNIGLSTDLSEYLEEDIELSFEPSSPTYDPNTPPTSPTSTTASKEVDVATMEELEPCKGVKKKQCLEKEDCEWKPSATPGKHGKCVKKIVLKGGKTNTKQDIETTRMSLMDIKLVGDN